MSLILGLCSLATCAVVVACQQSYIAALRQTIADCEDDIFDLRETLALTRARAAEPPTGYRTRLRPVPPEICP